MIRLLHGKSYAAAVYWQQYFDAVFRYSILT